jgi:hypothetical protein
MHFHTEAPIPTKLGMVVLSLHRTFRDREDNSIVTDEA